LISSKAICILKSADSPLSSYEKVFSYFFCIVNPMDKGYKVFGRTKTTLSRRPPQVKSSKAQITARFHKIPMIRSEDLQLTSFSGLLILQLFFRRIRLKQRLKSCFSHSKVSPLFGRHLIVMLLVVHLIMEFRRLREVDY